jgi:hypothetical protein
MEKYKYLNKVFVRTKQVDGEKGTCVGCAFNDKETVNEYGFGCVEFGEVCDVNKTGNMIVFKEKVK